MFLAVLPDAHRRVRRIAANHKDSGASASLDQHLSRLTLHDPIWLLALAALPLIAWLRGRRRVPVLLVPFAAAWHRPSLAAPSCSQIRGDPDVPTG